LLVQTQNVQVAMKTKTPKLKVIRLQEADIKLSNKGISMYALLDQRRPNKKGTFPIRIRIMLNSLYRDYGTKQNASIDEFIKITNGHPRGNAADIKIEVLALLERAYKIIQDIDPFSFARFNEVYLNKQNNDKHNIYYWYDDKIKELKSNGQIGTALTYEYSKKSLQNFTNTEILTFDKITPKFLEKYESQMSNPTTVGIYLRPLRHIFNLALDHHSNFINDYPFKRRSHETNKYKIPSPRNIKKALTKVEVKSIYEYGAIADSPEAYYKDIWLFSYFANGINMKDICKLRYKNIKGNSIEFRRAKTERSNKNSKPITIVLTDDLNRIINEYGTKPVIKENYIFTFLKPKMNKEEEMAAIKQATKQTNKYIRRVAKALKIEANVSTYTARHSFATILKNAGVSPSFIGESMGHSSLKTTESYLGSFESEQRKDNIDKLKDW